jgi:hypothetical protein
MVNLESGAVIVLDTAPAAPPQKSCLSMRTDFESVLVDGGEVIVSADEVEEVAIGLTVVGPSVGSEDDDVEGCVEELVEIGACGDAFDEEEEGGEDDDGRY